MHRLGLPSMPNPLKKTQAHGLPSHAHVLGFNQKTRMHLSLEALVLGSLHPHLFFSSVLTSMFFFFSKRMIGDL